MKEETLVHFNINREWGLQEEVMDRLRTMHYEGTNERELFSIHKIRQANITGKKPKVLPVFQNQLPIENP